ncbi:transporter [Patiriisocius marinistellae]|uniref:Transporter n=2 Tax=Patiriisocius marinistellae TaxID=2494560 RepID=A0A5J4G0K7_9FLAO|nr:transporter [Patiriisocius marinistellae]
MVFAMTLMNAQDINDALRYSQDGIFGTARYQAMSGAFGALGGDISAISTNPAGSSVFLKSEGAATLALNDKENSTTFLNNNQKSVETDGNLGQAGAVFVIKNRNEESDWKKFTIGLNYNAAKNYDNEIFVNGTGNNSLANFFVNQANGVSLDLLELQNNETISSLYSFLGNTEGTTAQNAFLGYQGFIFDPVNPTNSNNTAYSSNVANGPVQQEYLFLSEGVNSKLTINLSTQFTDNFYFGINLNSHVIDYDQSTLIRERNSNTGSTISRIGFENNLSVLGSGFSAQIGAIGKFNNLRVGLTFDTPTWYQISEETSQRLSSTRLEDNENILTIVDPNIINIFEDYYLRTPGNLSASAGYVFSNKGLISIDYSYKDYGNIEFDTEFNDNVFNNQNTQINNNLQGASTIKIGGEYRVKNFSLRGGFRYEESPYANEDIMSSLSGFSLGLGYNWGRYNIDASYARAEQDKLESVSGLTTPIKVNTIYSNAALTFGFKF